MFQNISANPFANTVNLTQQSISITQNQMNQALTDLVMVLLQALESELSQVVNTLVDNIGSNNTTTTTTTTPESTTTDTEVVTGKPVSAPVSTQNPTIEQEVTANDINAAILAQDGIVNPSDVVG